MKNIILIVSYIIALTIIASTNTAANTLCKNIQEVTKDAILMKKQRVPKHIAEKMISKYNHNAKYVKYIVTQVYLKERNVNTITEMSNACKNSYLSGQSGVHL